MGAACPVYLAPIDDDDATQWTRIGYAESPTLMNNGSLELRLHLDTAPLVYGVGGSFRLIIDTPDQATLVAMLRRTRTREDRRDAAERMLARIVRDHPAT